MSFLTSKTFWVDAIERSIKTIAQAAVALLTASGVLGILDIQIVVLLSVSGMAGLISILTSIASAGKTESASLVVDTKTLK